MSKVKTLNTFKHIAFVTSVLLGMASAFTFIDGGRSIFGTISAGSFFAVLSLGYLKGYFNIVKQIKIASK
jgi:hypothetical protein